MCNNMVTPTSKKQQFYKQQLSRSHAKGGSPPKTQYGGHRKNTPSPPNYSEFKTPSKPMIPVSRCMSEPISKRRSVTPKSYVAPSSPVNFAGPKCLEPPIPTSLPRPPTTWTRSEMMPMAPTCRQALSFEDFVRGHGHNAPEEPTFSSVVDPLSQQLMMLLKVQN